MIDPSSETGFAIRMYGGLMVALCAFAMAVQQAVSKFGDWWSVLALSFVALVGILVFVSVRRAWNSRGGT